MEWVASGAACDNSRVGMDRLTLESKRKALAVDAVAMTIAIQATNRVATEELMMAMLVEES